MLHSFAIENCFSFRELTTIRMDVGSTTPKDERFITSPITGKNYSKILAVMGHNASGKSNLLKALSYFTTFIFISSEFSYNFSEVRFAFGGESDITSFELVGEISNKIYKYKLKVNKKYILEEQLKYKSNSENYKLIFERKFDGLKQDYILKYPRLTDFSKKNLRDKIEGNVSLVSHICYKSLDEIEQTGLLKDFWRFIIGFSANIDMDEDRIDMFKIVRAFKSDHKSIIKSLQYLKSIDIGLDDIEIKEDIPQNLIDAKKKFQSIDTTLSEFIKNSVEKSIKNIDKKIDFFKDRAYGVHNLNGKKYLIDIKNESHGTKKSILLFTKIINALNMGGVLIYDEIETNLHPLVIDKILDLFFSPETNPYNAQLICSTHNALILRRIDKTQLLIIEKDKSKSSHAYKIDHLHRRDTSLMEKYLAGIYGGIMSDF